MSSRWTRPGEGPAGQVGCATQPADLRPDWFRPHTARAVEGGGHRATLTATPTAEPGSDQDRAGHAAPAEVSATARGAVGAAMPEREEATDWQAHWRGEADRAAGYARARLRDTSSNTIGWGVAVVAGLLSLTGFQMFGDVLGWPALFRLPLQGDRRVAVEPMLLLWFANDMLAVIGMRQWMNPHFSEQTRRTGKWASVSALATSVGINVAGHALHGGPWAWIAVPASAIPPLLLYVVLLLRDRRIQDQEDQARRAREPFERRAHRVAEQASSTTRTTSRTARRTKTTKTGGQSRRSAGKPARTGRPGPDAPVTAELMAAARQAADQVAAAGQRLSRDRLAAALREIGQPANNAAVGHLVALLRTEETEDADVWKEAS